MEALASSILEWGVACRPLTGQPSSGDLQVVKSFTNGILIAALDGIGHGEEAAAAAMVARSILEAHAPEPVIALVERCHEGLRATRGVAMSVASFDVPHGLMTWLGVGNVQGALLRRGVASVVSEESLLLRGGVVGGHLPSLQAAVLPVSSGDTLIFTTDGVGVNFSRSLARNSPPQTAAENILAQHGKATDDALVLVARYLRDRP
ncbi:MAG TPA: SpoIIE family protein phosphatase [Candidatus Sulfotelmatobacter sp.]|nr:SpoIIE family protein phosphatase [Candidatus Sulfotelmatobacter sp.]